MKIIPEIDKMITEIEKVISGKRDAIGLLVATLLAGGHVLLEDVPGLGKTTLAKALGRAAGLNTKRAQFTPDVMASDLTGFTAWNKERDEFDFKPGMLDCNIFLADEINRTPPKTQSALLEAMEERAVSVDGKTRSLPSPFMVIATQNQLGYVGTYPLPEAQLDRFLMRVSLGYPSDSQELQILVSRANSRRRNGRHYDLIEEIKPVADEKVISRWIKSAAEVNVDPAVAEYIVGIIRLTRKHNAVTLGCSPRAGLLLMSAAQSIAFIAGRDYVIPEDVVNIIIPVLSHRIDIKREFRNVTPAQVIKECVNSMTVPAAALKSAATEF